VSKIPTPAGGNRSCLDNRGSLTAAFSALLRE
jgi:hypothetical protein